MANNPRTFLDLSIGEDPLGRVVFELFKDQVPKTVENFRCLSTGERGVSALSGKPLHYKGSPLHRIIDGFMIQGGDITLGNGRGGESMYGAPFEDESLEGEIDAPGLLVMANKGPDTNGSQFFITLGPASHLTGKHVLFGKVVAGMQHVEAVAKVSVDAKDRPQVSVLISHCGELERRIKAKPPPRKRSASVSSASSDASSASSSSVSSEEERRRKRKAKRREQKREKKRSERKHRSHRHNDDFESRKESHRRSESPEERTRLALPDERRLELERRREQLMAEMEAEKNAERQQKRQRREQQDGQIRPRGRGVTRWRDDHQGSRSGMRAWT